MSPVRNRDRIYKITIMEYIKKQGVVIKPTSSGRLIAICLPERTVFSVQAGF